MSTKVAKKLCNHQKIIRIFNKFKNQMNFKILIYKCLKLVIILLIVTSSNAQTDTSASFPQDFFGKYTGILHISSEKGMSEVPMEFHLAPTDSIGKFDHILIYGEGETRQERRYTIRTIDAAKGQFVIDENNGILLDTQVVENRLYTLFEVGGNLLTNFITFHKDHLIFEIIFANTSEKIKSGKTTEEIPEVISYPIKVVQRAVLNKVKS